MSQASLPIDSPRLFLRNGGAALSGTAVAVPVGREALAQSTTVSLTNLHDFAPTQFQEVGDAGHAPHQQHPTEVAAQVERFLSKD